MSIHSPVGGYMNWIQFFILCPNTELEKNIQVYVF